MKLDIFKGSRCYITNEPPDGHPAYGSENDTEVALMKSMGRDFGGGGNVGDYINEGVGLFRDHRTGGIIFDPYGDKKAEEEFLKTAEQLGLKESTKRSMGRSAWRNDTRIG